MSWRPNRRRPEVGWVTEGDCLGGNFTVVVSNVQGYCLRDTVRGYWPGLIPRGTLYWYPYTKKLCLFVFCAANKQLFVVLFVSDVVNFTMAAPVFVRYLVTYTLYAVLYTQSHVYIHVHVLRLSPVLLVLNQVDKPQHATPLDHKI